MRMVPAGREGFVWTAQSCCARLPVAFGRYSAASNVKGRGSGVPLIATLKRKGLRKKRAFRVMNSRPLRWSAMPSTRAMGKRALVLLCLRLTVPCKGADVDELNLQSDAPKGWASVGDGTKGGAGGATYDVSDAKTLRALVGTDRRKAIHVRGVIRLKSDLRMGSNTSLIGIGAKAALIGGGLHIRKVQNIIVRNLAITEASDAVNIEEAHHVWIDHCELSKCRDGLIDIKRGSDFITVSWNHLHDHRKACLLGHSDKPGIRRMDTGKLHVTYHHNFFDGTKTRHPRIRYADPVHVFNNYFRGNEYGVASVMDAGAIVEGNYFEDVEHPTLIAYGDSPDPGRLVERHNVFVRCGEPQSAGEVDEKGISYDYTLANARSIPEIVKSGAGVGRLPKGRRQ